MLRPRIFYQKSNPLRLDKIRFSIYESTQIDYPSHVIKILDWPKKNLMENFFKKFCFALVAQKFSTVNIFQKLPQLQSDPDGVKWENCGLGFWKEFPICSFQNFFFVKILPENLTSK